MRRIDIKKINLKSGKDIKLVGIMTLFICALLIISPLIFLGIGEGHFNPFNLSNDSIVKNSTKITFPVNGKVKLYRKEKNTVEELNLEEYIMGVVASEMPASFTEEALKAQAVAARTFYMNKRNKPSKELQSKGAEITDTTDCQVYMSKEERMKSWRKDQAESNWEKIQKAVEETKGQVITYEGQVLEYPQFFAVSSGKTENAKDVFASDVPYLKSEESKGEEIAPKYKTSISIPISDFVNKINDKYPSSNATKSNIASIVKINEYTEAGSIKELKIGKEIVKGTTFRTLFNLNSTNFTLNFKSDKVVVNCLGYGHGVGMSQWGANIMAKNGSKYDEILKHYYNGVEIQKISYK